MTLLLVPPELPAHLFRRDGLVYAHVTRRPWPAPPPTSGGTGGGIVAEQALALRTPRLYVDDDRAEGEPDEGPRRVFDSPDALEVYLDQLGFTATATALGGTAGTLVRSSARDRSRPPVVDGVEVVESLRRRGRALAVDWETGHLPVPHHALLDALAGLTTALAGVAFEQALPRDIESDEPQGLYRLFAHDGGVRRRGWARSLGDFYDVDSCVGFINSLLSVRRSPDRLLVAQTGAHDGCVVAGPRRALRTLRDEGLLVAADEAWERG